MKGRTEYSPEKVAQFLAELASLCNVTRAAAAVNLNRRTIYDWRDSYPEFKARMDETLEGAIDDLEQEARRRAYQGVDEPVYYKGEVCGAIRKYSDTLLIFLLKANRAKYRDRLTVDVQQLQSDIERELAQLAAGRASSSSESTESETIN